MKLTHRQASRISSFEKLTHLKCLDFADCGVTKLHFDSLLTLSTLQKLKLSSYVDFERLCLMKRLSHLCLFHIDITSHNIVSMPHVTFLSVDNCVIPNTFFQKLCSWSQLTGLHMRNFDLDTSFSYEDLSKLTTLEELHLGPSLLTYLGTEVLCSLLNLRHLLLENIYMEGSLKYQKNLHTLSLINSPLGKDLCLDIKDMKSLRELSFSTMSFQDISPLADISQLESLTVSQCHIDSKDPFEFLKRYVSLHTLILDGNDWIKDSKLEAIKYLTNLHTLNLSNCSKLSCDSIAYLRACNLKMLNVSGTNVKMISDALSRQCPLLESLDLSHTFIIDSCLKNLASITSLQNLALSGCKSISGAHVKYLSSLKNLKSLDISFMSQLKTPHIYPLLRLPRLNELDISFTQISFEDAISLPTSAHTTVIHIENVELLSY